MSSFTASSPVISKWNLLPMFVSSAHSLSLRELSKWHVGHSLRNLQLIPTSPWTWTSLIMHSFNIRLLVLFILFILKVNKTQCIDCDHLLNTHRCRTCNALSLTLAVSWPRGQWGWCLKACLPRPHQLTLGFHRVQSSARSCSSAISIFSPPLSSPRSAYSDNCLLYLYSMNL